MTRIVVHSHDTAVLPSNILQLGFFYMVDLSFTLFLLYLKEIYERTIRVRLFFWGQFLDLIPFWDEFRFDTRTIALKHDFIVVALQLTPTIALADDELMGHGDFGDGFS
jgi:hypothetical protein